MGQPGAAGAGGAGGAGGAQQNPFAGMDPAMM